MLACYIISSVLAYRLEGLKFETDRNCMRHIYTALCACPASLEANFQSSTVRCMLEIERMRMHITLKLLLGLLMHLVEERSVRGYSEYPHGNCS